jgi:ATP-dependent DNA helicase RecG
MIGLWNSSCARSGWSMEITPPGGGLIGCGIDPQAWVPGAYVQFLRIDGLSLTDPIKHQKELTGKLEDVLRRLDELFEINISVRTRFVDVPREARQPDYPLVALQQLGRNAVMHRTYEGTNAPVRVYWYSDRVEIQNPGGLYGQVTQENIGTGVTDYRNPLIAEMMHHLGFAQRFGMGLPIAQKALEDNGNPPPEFHFSSTHVAVTVRSAI